MDFKGLWKGDDDKLYLVNYIQTEGEDEYLECVPVDGGVRQVVRNHDYRLWIHKVGYNIIDKIPHQLISVLPKRDNIILIHECKIKRDNQGDYLYAYVQSFISGGFLKGVLGKARVDR